MSVQAPGPIAALGWLHTGGHDAQLQSPLQPQLPSQTHLALPTDLFLLTVHCGAGAEFELSVTLLRTRPERFRSRSGGELAFALLTPGGALALLRAPLGGACDRRLPLAQFCSRHELAALRDALLGADDADDRVRVFGRWIETRLHQRHRYGAVQQRVADAATLIQQAAGAADLAAVRSVVHVSQRHLERAFRLWLGVSPGTYARSVRFQRAAVALAAGAAPGDTAAAHHFADQSHLHRVFRQLSGLTPREFARWVRLPQRGAISPLAGRLVVVQAPVLPAPAGRAPAARSPRP